jgi:hypothetical protein
MSAIAGIAAAESAILRQKLQLIDDLHAMLDCVICNKALFAAVNFKKDLCRPRWPAPTYW